MDGDRAVETFKARVSPVVETLTDRGETREVIVDEAENAVYWLYRRKHISEEQFAAGERLRQDYTHGQLAARVTADWEREIERLGRGRSGYGFLTDKALAAKLRFHKAIDAIGPEFSGMLIEVCCLAAGIEQAERQLNLPIRSGKTILSLALTRLARHYGMIKPDEAAREPRATRHWGIEGYRPEKAKDGE
jgi:hypothetical protein